MSDIIPRKHAERIAFFKNHIAPWTSGASQIGTTAAAVTSLNTLTEDALAALAAQEVAHQAAMAATNDLKVKLAAMTNAGSDIVKQIRAQAAISGDGVYTTAEIPAPATPGPCGELTMPGAIKAEIDQTGELKLSWKCTQPRAATGTSYEVFRRIGNSGPFNYVGRAGGKQFTDATIPAGSAAVTYKIRANRSTSVSPWAQFVVNFGMEAGSMTASISAPKIAA